MLLGLTVSLWAQESFTVTGTVTDDKNEPLVGVSVVIADNPGLGAITDLDGKYSIKGVTQYSKLVYTYIGYTKAERMVRNQRVINVKLKEAVDNVIDQVVVTAMGNRKKINVTGAVTNVDVEELKVNPTSSISNSLAGVVPGIQAMATSGRPGSVSEFWVRSISTFGANSSALVLVDGRDDVEVAFGEFLVLRAGEDRIEPRLAG